MHQTNYMYTVADTKKFPFRLRFDVSKRRSFSVLFSFLGR